MKTTDVARAWLRGERARSRFLVTKNGKIWSYDTLIGKTMPDGTLVIYDYTNSAGNFISRATTGHVTDIIGVAWKEANDGRNIVISTNVPKPSSRDKDDQLPSA